MITINTLIDDKFKALVNEKEIARDDRMEQYYNLFPELRELDRKIVEVRCDSVWAALELDDHREHLFVERREELLSRRAKFLEEHKIPSDFDQIRCICPICNDTGYKLNKKGNQQVCTCCNEELIECYNLSGLKDYSTYTLESYKKDYYGDAVKRTAILKGLIGVSEPSDTDSLYIYSDAHATGKTYISVCVVKALIRAGKAARFLRAGELGDLDKQAISNYKNCEYLLIDDFTAETTRKYQATLVLNEILESRMASNKVTVVVSASSQENLCASSDRRIASKLARASEIGES